jgi:hypothetical protein
MIFCFVSTIYICGCPTKYVDTMRVCRSRTTLSAVFYIKLTHSFNSCCACACLVFCRILRCTCRFGNSKHGYSARDHKNCAQTAHYFPDEQHSVPNNGKNSPAQKACRVPCTYCFKQAVNAASAAVERSYIGVCLSCVRDISG